MRIAGTLIKACVIRQGAYRASVKPAVIVRSRQAFTLIELLVVIAIIAIVAVLLFPNPHDRRKPRVTACASNLKKLGESFSHWSQAHDGKLPMQISITNQGSMELAESGPAVIHFLALTNSGSVFPESDRAWEPPNNAQGKWVTHWTTNYGLGKAYLVCPSDWKRRISDSSKQRLAELSDTNISYFVGLDTQVDAKHDILAGDRHVQIANQSTNSGLHFLTPDSSVSWSKELHYAESGNLLFADGHVEFASTKKLRRFFGNQSHSSYRVVIP